MKVTVPGKTPLERLINLTKSVIAVPKSDIEREEQKWQRRRAKKRPPRTPELSATRQIRQLNWYRVAGDHRLAMLARDVAQTSARDLVPPCIICQRSRSVRNLACTASGMACWTCDDCLVSWVTDNSARSTAAERSPRQFA